MWTTRLNCSTKLALHAYHKLNYQCNSMEDSSANKLFHIIPARIKIYFCSTIIISICLALSDIRGTWICAKIKICKICLIDNFSVLLLRVYRCHWTCWPNVNDVIETYQTILVSFKIGNIKFFLSLNLFCLK